VCHRLLCGASSRGPIRVPPKEDCVPTISPHHSETQSRVVQGPRTSPYSHGYLWSAHRLCSPIMSERNR
jgi:hypothetical protein